MAKGKKAKSADVGSNGPSDDQVRKAMREVSETATKLEEQQGIHRAMCKRWQDAGVDTKLLMKVRKDKGLDPEQVELDEKNRVRYRALFGLMPTHQPDMFLAPEDPEHVRWTAGELGYASGKRGDDPESACPFSPGTEQYVVWQERFDQGRAAGQAELQPGEKKASTRRKRTPRGEDAAAPVH